MIFSEVAYPHSQVLCLLFQLVKLEFGTTWKWWCLRRGEKKSSQRKISQSKGDVSNNKFSPHNAVDTSIWTQAKLMEDKCSHHCATAPCFPFPITCCLRICMYLKKLVMWTSAEINESTCDSHSQMTNLRLGKKVYVYWLKKKEKKKTEQI